MMYSCTKGFKTIVYHDYLEHIICMHMLSFCKGNSTFTMSIYHAGENIT